MDIADRLKVLWDLLDALEKEEPPEGSTHLAP